VKSATLTLAPLLLLTASATGQIAPPPKAVPCPVPPALVVEQPERNWLGQMENFLQGTLPTQPGLKLPSTNASSSTKP
jgi:hypothetical protein